MPAPYTGKHLFRVWFNVASGGFDCEEVRADSAEEAAAYLRQFKDSCSAQAHRATIISTDEEDAA